MIGGAIFVSKSKTSDSVPRQCPEGTTEISPAQGAGKNTVIAIRPERMVEKAPACFNTDCQPPFHLNPNARQKSQLAIRSGVSLERPVNHLKITCPYFGSPPSAVLG
jgi:hypothetical protein